MRLWFKRKPGNRRLGREHVLDVKLRSSQLRATRARMAAVAVGVVFATIFGLFMIWRTSQWALDELVYQNRSFELQEIEVQTDGVIAVDQLRRWSGIKPGQNLLALDLGRVKRDLELIPVVQSAAVERILPHTLQIRVIEREPVAQIYVARPRAGGGIDLATFQLDPEGCVMQPLEPRQRTTPAGPHEDQLPIVSGVKGNEVQPGRRIEAPEVQAALQLILSFWESPMAGLVDLKRIEVSSPQVLTVTTGQGNEITFGLKQPELQLQRWHRIFLESHKASKVIASLDLAVTNNIPVRLVDASGAEIRPPKSLKPLRTKRKHV